MLHFALIHNDCTMLLKNDQLRQEMKKIRTDQTQTTKELTKAKHLVSFYCNLMMRCIHFHTKFNINCAGGGCGCGAWWM
jgi:hypothetical protein